MERYIRGDKSPVPRKLDKYLTQAQTSALRIKELLGWTVAFVRRPLFQKPTLIMVDTERNQYEIIEEDGTTTLDIDIDLRSDPVLAEQENQNSSITNIKPKIHAIDTNNPLKTRVG